MSATEAIYVGTVAAVSSAPVLVGRGFARLRSRRAHRAALLAIVAVSLGIGAWAYVERASGVPDSRALIGASIATMFVGLLPLTVYFEVGFWVRSRIALAVFVLVAAVPLIFYGFIALLAVSTYTECTAGQYECPI